MKGSVDAKKRSVGQFVKHLSGMGIKADASAMPNLKTRTLPGAPGPRMIVRGRGDDERGERAAGGRASRSASADAPMGGDGSEEGVVRMRSSSVPPHGHTVLRAAPLAVPQLGTCAYTGRAWRLWAARHSQEEAGPLGAPPLPWVLELAAAKASPMSPPSPLCRRLRPSRCRGTAR